MTTPIKKTYLSPTIAVVEIHAKKAVLLDTSAEGMNWENPEES